MIMFVRTLDVQFGKMKEAVAWAKKRLAFYTDIGAPGERHVVRNINGNVDQLYIVYYFESLAVFDELDNKMQSNQDPKYQELGAESKTIFLANTRNFYETID